ncbi:hypothetical protein MJC1_02743 [Methylocystis sp. MJC1]|jgi:hypothetical protein|nr:hypothetical protein MJC1_02743 [Methylocystis sp. MJC1]
MMLAKSKIAPAIFWVGFLALGFVSSFAETGKPRKAHDPGKRAAAVESQLGKALHD